MLNGTLKILGIVVLFLVVLILSGQMVIREYRTMDYDKFETLLNAREAARGDKNASLAIEAAGMSKVYITTHYRIAVR